MSLDIANNLVEIKDAQGNVVFSTNNKMPHIIHKATYTKSVTFPEASRSSQYGLIGCYPFVGCVYGTYYFNTAQYWTSEIDLGSVAVTSGADHFIFGLVKINRTSAGSIPTLATVVKTGQWVPFNGSVPLETIVTNYSSIDSLNRVAHIYLGTDNKLKLHVGSSHAQLLSSIDGGYKTTSSSFTFEIKAYVGRY